MKDKKKQRQQKRTKYKVGKLCPKCNKAKFQPCDQKGKEGHGHHVVCPTCHNVNF